MPSKVPYGCRRGWIVASRVRALRFGCTLIRMFAMRRFHARRRQRRDLPGLHRDR